MGIKESSAYSVVKGPIRDRSSVFAAGLESTVAKGKIGWCQTDENSSLQGQ